MISQKNGEITKSVLKGYTLRQVGNIYGLSPERIRQITRKTCRKVNFVNFKRAVSSNRSIPAYFIIGGIKELRKHKNYFISLIDLS